MKAGRQEIGGTEEKNSAHKPDVGELLEFKKRK